MWAEDRLAAAERPTEAAKSRRDRRTAPRVLFIAGSQDARVGGPAFSAANMWVAARRAGIAGTSAFPVAEPPSPAEIATIDRLRAEGIELRGLGYSAERPKRMRWGMSLRLALWLLLSAWRYDIIQAHGAWMVPSLIGLAAARLGGGAFILVPHESMTRADVFKGAGAVRHAIKRLIKAIYLRFSDALIVASEIEARESTDTRAARRCDVLYHPVFDDRAPLPSPRRWPAEMRELRVGFLGRFDPKKNIELLLEAAAESPRVSLHMAGSGSPSYEAQLRRLAETKGLGGRVRWLGFIGAEQKARFFDGIDILTMPSIQEGFGMVAAEAMCRGLPVIVSKTSGIAELVERYQCGWVVPAEVDAVRAAFQRALADPSMLDACSVQALEAVREELAFGLYGKRIARIFRELRPGDKGGTERA